MREVESQGTMHFDRTLIFICVCVLHSTSAEIPEVSNSVVRNFLETYDRSKAPSFDGPASVKVGIYANDIRANERTSELEVTMYMRRSWQDKRVKALFTDEDKSDKMYLEVSAHKYFWRPDLFFRNHRASDARESLTEESLMRVNSDGKVWHVTSHRTTFNCPGLPRHYSLKMPQVKCSIIIESFSHTMDDLVLLWLGSPFAVDPSIILVEFTLSNIEYFDCSQNYTSGAYPCLEIKLTLDRDSAQDHVGKCLYVSSALLVVAAWAGFWLDGRKQMLVRLLLGLGSTAILVLELAGAATWYSEWDLMGNKTQFWLAFCTLLGSVTVVEQMVAHVALRLLVGKVRGGMQGGPVLVDSEGEEIECESWIGRIVDVVFGIGLYPAAFIIFIFVFFIKHWNIF